MDQSEDNHEPKSVSGDGPNDSLAGPGLRPRSVVLITIVLLLLGIGGYVGYWVAMGRYAVVDPGRLYRSAEYDPWRLVEECKRLGIRTVVDFRKDSPEVDAEAEALGKAGVRYAHLATDQVPPPEVVDAFLEIMSDEANLPVLIHCEHGVGRTGLHAAIYRMEFQGWSKRCARIEAMLLAGFDSFQKDTDKARFIESYTPDPDRLPMRKFNVALFIVGPLVALTAYLYGLDSIHIPKIGDEPPYLQIARVTAESGRMLPLVWDRGIYNTKPPMLFWQGILTSGWGKYWNPWTLRGPIVLYSFAIALLIGLFTRRLSGDARTGLVAGLIYLGFLSTIQHGRPFLTNAPETLFLFLPLVIMFRADSTTVRNTLLCGLCFGMAALYKSFFLIFVGAFALGLVLLYRADFKPLAFLKRYGAFFTGAVLLGLGVFSLWLVLDPYPEKVLSQFLIKENVGKFNLTNLWTGLYSGSHSLWRLWVGDFANAGLYAVVLLGLVIDTVRRRKQLAPREKQLWLYILGFLIIYSIPTQRQENYILPTCAALSVLLALRWQALPALWFRITLIVAAFMFLVTIWVQWEVERAFGAQLFSWKNCLVPLLFFALSLFSLARIETGRFLLPLIALGALLTASLFLDPFSRKYSEEALRELQGKTVYFPSRTNLIKHEIYRFILPGANVVGYTKQHPLDEIDHTYCARIIDLDEEIPEGYRLIDQVYNLKTRHTNQQIKDMIFHRRMELMLDRLALLEKKEG